MEDANVVMVEDVAAGISGLYAVAWASIILDCTELPPLAPGAHDSQCWSCGAHGRALSVPLEAL